MAAKKKKAITESEARRIREEYWKRLEEERVRRREAEVGYEIAPIEVDTDLYEGSDYSSPLVDVSISLRECLICHSLVNENTESLEQHTAWHNEA